MNYTVQCINISMFFNVDLLTACFLFCFAQLSINNPELDQFMRRIIRTAVDHSKLLTFNIQQKLIMQGCWLALPNTIMYEYNTGVHSSSARCRNLLMTGECDVAPQNTNVPRMWLVVLLLYTYSWIIYILVNILLISSDKTD